MAFRIDRSCSLRASERATNRPIDLRSGDATSLKTIVAEPTQKPIWNATLFFTGVDGESLMERAIEVTLWDYCPEGDNVFLGESTVDVQRALENDRAVW